MALASISDRPLPPELNGARLLGERAAIAGYTRNGSISAGGSCRFLETSDGWITLNLARDDDWESLPALVQRDIPPDWSALADAVLDIATDGLVAQGRQLGLAIAKHGFDARPGSWPWIQVQGAERATRSNSPPLVIELASLWAGPLCGHLLHITGARVIKVESVHRPDGARFGAARFPSSA